MNYEIIEKPAFAVSGKSIRVTMNDGGAFADIPKFWDTCASDGTVAMLAQLSAAGKVVPGSILGVCTDFSPESDAFTYMIAAEDNMEHEGLVGLAIPAATYAAFQSVGPMPDAIQNLWREIMSDFLVNEPYAHAQAPDIEIYGEGDPYDAGYTCQIWIPVTVK